MGTKSFDRILIQATEIRERASESTSTTINEPYSHLKSPAKKTGTLQKRTLNNQVSADLGKNPKAFHITSSVLLS